MRGSAVWAALSHPELLTADYDVVWASSYVPLAELVGLCPALAACPRVLYFHENQLTYPWQQAKVADRDLHYGVTQMVSALAATRCVFNSAYNRDSFLAAARGLLARMPDAVPPQWVSRIEARSEVLGVPMDLPDVPPPLQRCRPAEAGPLILWNHRWEHDKNPTAFFAALRTLADRDVPFELAVCGQRYRRIPEAFEAGREALSDRIVHWGHLESRRDYVALLQRADIAVSTADHEFFGVAMLEATHHGACPLVPDRLAYRELFPEARRYADEATLVVRLEAACRRFCAGESLRADRRSITAPHTMATLAPRYRALLKRVRQRST